MATTRKSIISTADRVINSVDRYLARLEGLKEVAGGENKDKAVTVAYERVAKAFESLTNNANVLSEKAADFGSAEAPAKAEKATKVKAKEEAPKKRGRKPKAETEVAEEAPKKRGRKPKAETEEKPAKKRGRKPKSEKIESEKPAKKKKKAKAVEDTFEDFSFDDEEEPKKVSKKDKAAAKSEKKKKKSRK